MSEARPRPAIETFADAAALAQATADIIAETLDRRLEDGAETVRFVATGGSTPIAAYETLRDWPLDWSRVEITLSDERWVDPAAPESNEGMLRRCLLTGGAAAARFTPLWSAEASPEAAALRAEPAIRRLLPFDVVLLGVGDDGHIASLFPGSPALAEGLDPAGKRLCIGTPKATLQPMVRRISLTLRALLDAQIIIVLTSGGAKKGLLEAAMQGAMLPVRAVLAQDRTPVRVLWAP
jgi:6-phosphogluconolactonase